MLADYIIQRCLENEELSEQSRIDGLRIAGFTCYRDGDLVRAVSAFEPILGMTGNDRWLGEANRVLAQIKASRGQLQEALAQFETAWTHSIAEDPDGQYITTRSVLSQICMLTDLLGQHQKGLEYALLGISLYEESTLLPGIVAPYVYWAYRSMKGEGDAVGASEFLEELLDGHPEFGCDDAFIGLRPILMIDLHKLNGRDWQNPSKDFMDTAISILNDERFTMMPSRLHVAGEFCDMLERMGQHTAAVQTRERVYHQVNEGLTLDPDIDVVHKGALLDRSQYLLYRNAMTLHAHFGDHQAALDVIDTLRSAQEPLTPMVSSLVDGLETELEAHAVPVNP